MTMTAIRTAQVYRVSFTKNDTEFVCDEFQNFLSAAVEAESVRNWHGNARLTMIEFDTNGKTVFISDALPY